MDEFIDTSKETIRSIPSCRFIENVESFVRNRNIPALQEGLKELLVKYRYTKNVLEAQTQSQNNRIPDLEEALQVIKLLKDRKESTFEAQFNLSEIIYAKARIPPTEVAYLWLGANTMVQYTLDEAKAVLEKNLKNAEHSVKNNVEDMEWLQTQITIAEVNVARLHNFSVKIRQPSTT